MEGEEVIILMPDSTQTLTKRWTGPGVIHRKRSEKTYEIMMNDGSIKKMHANFCEKEQPT